VQSGSSPSGAAEATIDTQAHEGTRTGSVRRGWGWVPAPRAVFGSLASGVLGQLALVVTGVITTRTLGPTDRGYLALVVLVPNVLLIVGTLGLPRAVTFYIASDRSQESAVLRAIRVPVLAQIVVLTLTQAALVALLVYDEPERVHWAALVALPMLGGAIVDYYSKAILQGQGRYLLFNILRNAAVTFYLVGVLGVFLTGHAGLVEFAIAVSVSAVAAGIVSAYAATAGRPSVAPEQTDVSRDELMRFGLRGYFVSLSPIGVFQLDQALIGLFLSPRSLGLYVAALAFTNLPLFIARSIGLIAFPQVARAGATQAQEMRRFLVFSIVSVGLVVALLELAAGVLVPLFFGSDFDEAVLLTRILLIGALFGGIRRVLTDVASGAGRPGLGSFAEVTAWFVVLPAMAILAPVWGVDGVAAAVAISSAASLLTLVVLVRRSGTGRDPSRDVPRPMPEAIE
jgi:O-antigen/teichoic acid export membrane protein